MYRNSFGNSLILASLLTTAGLLGTSCSRESSPTSAPDAQSEESNLVESSDPFSVDRGGPSLAAGADALVAWTFFEHGSFAAEFSNYNALTNVPTPGLTYSGFPTDWSLSTDGRFLAFTDYPGIFSAGLLGAPGDHQAALRVDDTALPSDVLLYDRHDARTLVLPISTSRFPEAAPAISASGRFIAYVGRKGIQLFDREREKLIQLPRLKHGRSTDREPSLSDDARYVAFTSDRTGSLDVLLYDRQLKSLLDLPGLNTASDERSPSISGDGNLIAFITNASGQTQFNLVGPSVPPCEPSYVRIYDRSTASLVALPGIHDFFDEFDSCSGSDWWQDDDPSINSAGTLLAFISGRFDPSDYHPDLFLYDLTTNSLRNIFSDAREPSIR